MHVHPHHGLSNDRVIAFSDAQLVDELFDAIERVAERDDDLGDRLFFLAGEVVDRFAPAVALAERERMYAGKPDELESSLEFFRRDQAARSGGPGIALNRVLREEDENDA